MIPLWKSVELSIAALASSNHFQIVLTVFHSAETAIIKVHAINVCLPIICPTTALGAFLHAPLTSGLINPAEVVTIALSIVTHAVVIQSALNAEKASIFRMDLAYTVTKHVKAVKDHRITSAIFVLFLMLISKEFAN